jgi:excisionase family DNA binding protein
MQMKEVLVMTIDEVAEYLRIPRSSLYKLAQEGRIPCQKVGRHWRFRREALDRWLEANQGAPPTGEQPHDPDVRQRVD